MRLLLALSLLAVAASSWAQTVATCPQIPNAVCKDGTVPLTADWSVNSHKITNLTDPAALQDAATKNYVDQVAGGLETRAARLASAAALPANTYSNGVGGVGATLTATANGALSVDSTTVAVGDRLLIKNESAQANNGIYAVTATGSAILPYILTRTIDSNDGDDFAANVVLVTAGSANANTAWLCTVGSITVGTDPITYTQYQVGQGTTVGGDLTGTVGSATVRRVSFPTLPAFRACGQDAGSTGTVAPGLPTGHVANDILVLFIQSANEAVACPSGYAGLGPPAGTGTAAGSGATRITTCWKRDGGSESIPTVADSGNHTYAVICAFSGAKTTGDPFHFLSSGVKVTASTSTSASAGTTTVDNALVVFGVAQAINSASGQYSAEADTDLTSVTERTDAGVAVGVGGGLMVTTGTKATAGTISDLTATVASTAEAFSSFALVGNDTQQIGNAPRACEVQTFINPGTPTWYMPSGAKTVEVIAIGGGGAGGAGRSAATAVGSAGGGGGAYTRAIFRASEIASSVIVTVGAGGIGGSTKSTAGSSAFANGLTNTLIAGPGAIGADATSGTTGASGGGGNVDNTTRPAAANPAVQGIGGQGAGGVTAVNAIAGSHGEAGGGSGGTGTTTNGAPGAGGTSTYGGGGGGGGDISGSGATGGRGGNGGAPGGAHASCVNAGILTLGGSGGGGGDGTSTFGGNGCQPGGAGGGGGNATASGGNGGDGAVTVISCF